ncbi:MAG: PDZ domain-containing protein [Planctomycetota bacterium]
MAAALRAQKTQLHQARRRLQEERRQRASRLLVAFGVRGTKWLPRKSGFFVQEVRKGSPAERLGLRRGDVIVNVNGRAVTESRDFPAALGDKPDWSRVTVTRLRNGQHMRLTKR